jgi:hypothetical protein
MKFVNLTPHTIRISRNGVIEEIPVFWTVARVTVVDEVVGEINGIPLVAGRAGEVTGLPDPVEGVVFIVSGMVLAELKGSRPDVVAPDTGNTAIRENGNVSAVTRLRIK